MSKIIKAGCFGHFSGLISMTLPWAPIKFVSFPLDNLVSFLLLLQPQELKRVRGGISPPGQVPFLEMSPLLNTCTHTHTHTHTHTLWPRHFYSWELCTFSACFTFLTPCPPLYSHLVWETVSDPEGRVCAPPVCLPDPGSPDCPVIAWALAAMSLT